MTWIGSARWADCPKGNYTVLIGRNLSYTLHQLLEHQNCALYIYYSKAIEVLQRIAYIFPNPSEDKTSSQTFSDKCGPSISFVKWKQKSKSTGINVNSS